MGNLFILNASDSEIFISLNNGGYLSVPPAAQDTWTASRPKEDVQFINNTTTVRGQLNLGANKISLYPGTSGPTDAVTFGLEVPKNVRVTSIELYLFWKSATSVAWVALNAGQPFQVSFTTESMVMQNNSVMNALPPYTITASL